jgi:hypothetical protein
MLIKGHFAGASAVTFRIVESETWISSILVEGLAVAVGLVVVVDPVVGQGLEAAEDLVAVHKDLSSNDHNDQARDVPKPLQKMSLILENSMGIPVSRE